MLSKEKPAFIFLLKLIILLAALKTIFFIYNYSEGASLVPDLATMILWSLLNDLLIIIVCWLPFFIGLLFRIAFIRSTAMYVSIGMLVFMLLLNTIDIFYFPFHRQRADVDLFYVLRDPGSYGNWKIWLILVFGLLFMVVASWYFIRQLTKLEKIFRASPPPVISVLMILFLAFFMVGGRNALLPSRALTKLPADKLPVVQNSLHTFLYSTYRGGNNSLLSKSFIPEEQRTKLFSIQKKNMNVSSSNRNIVLFIMESIPYEFFDAGNPSKPPLPFFDSLLNHSVLFKNAFSYSYSSNKGITAILSGLPTITDIPLYHSGFTNIEKTGIGERLAGKNYHSSFFIGDNYDDFGFAKCANWLGIQHYYSMEDIPGYKQLEKHTMGLHDEYVLRFFQEKMKTMPQPFFATQYNVSTHYPNDLTSAFKKKLSGLDLSPAAKSMIYYDHCMQAFFAEAKKQGWYNNSVFIFCSDHWAAPEDPRAALDVVNSFRIPIIIFDPQINQKVINTNLVSQMDVMNSALSYAADSGSFLSYGESLLDSAKPHRIVFTKTNNSVYQAINDSLVLGFDADLAKAVYGYKYKTDLTRGDNLVKTQPASITSLEKDMRTFLQTAILHYNSRLKK